jgi:hypothetical protein
MKKKSGFSMLSLMCIVLVFPVSIPVVSATDGLDARTHNKVMRAKRAQAMDRNSGHDKSSGLPPVGSQQQAQNSDPCKAGIDIGNVYTGNSNRGMPRENIVVVTGDVIFAPNRNCR